MPRPLAALLLFLCAAARADLLVMTWNLAGNGATNWSVTSPQIQAIGRILQHLRPDVVAFQEIPWDQRAGMPRIVQTYLPGYALAVSPGTDFVLTSAVATRHALTRTASHLDNASLADFGFAGQFTRDLFEAEIAVPGWPRPFHLFTTHLRAGNNFQLRGAEAGAISNHLARNFLPARGDRPWLLCGDLNQDIRRPPSSNFRPVERLVNTHLGTVLLTPTNSVAAFQDYTWSARAGLNIRFDYVIPGAVLASNVVSGSLFYSPTLGNTVPGIDRTTSSTASDHLPVLVRFRDPVVTEPPSFALSFALETPSAAVLSWPDTGAAYAHRVDRTANLADWVEIGSGLRTNRLRVPLDDRPAWFRVVRTP